MKKYIMCGIISMAMLLSACAQAVSPQQTQAQQPQVQQPQAEQVQDQQTAQASQPAQTPQAEQQTETQAAQPAQTPQAAPQQAAPQQVVPQTPQGIGEVALTQDDAKRIALETAGLTESNTSFLRVSFDFDDGISKYEVEFVSGTTEYDIDVDANSGAVVGYDYESVYD